MALTSTPLPTSEEASQLSGGLASRPRYDALRVLLRNPTAAAGTALIVLYVLLALLGPVLAPNDPYAQDLRDKLTGPGLPHLLGTDSLGRDILSRILYGARLSVPAGFGVVASAIVIGTLAGVIAGYFGGVLDDAVMRITDMFLAFPGLILAMAIAAILRPSLTNALIAVAVTWWPGYARLIRGQALAIKSLQYIEAERSLGAGDIRIIGRHILPNSFAPVLVKATLDVGAVILTVAGLSFIGFGAQPPTPEWGAMVSDGRSFLQTQWWMPTFPALAVLLLVLACNLAGDGLRDMLDPRDRR
jgi:peptide/nickel transport system permease protein